MFPICKERDTETDKTRQDRQTRQTEGDRQTGIKNWIVSKECGMADVIGIAYLHACSQSVKKETQRQTRQDKKTRQKRQDRQTRQTDKTDRRRQTDRNKELDC